MPKLKSDRRKPRNSGAKFDNIKKNSLSNYEEPVSETPPVQQTTATQENDLPYIFQPDYYYHFPENLNDDLEWKAKVVQELALKVGLGVMDVKIVDYPNTTFKALRLSRADYAKWLFLHSRVRELQTIDNLYSVPTNYANDLEADARLFGVMGLPRQAIDFDTSETLLHANKRKPTESDLTVTDVCEENPLKKRLAEDPYDAYSYDPEASEFFQDFLFPIQGESPLSTMENDVNFDTSIFFALDGLEEPVSIEQSDNSPGSELSLSPQILNSTSARGDDSKEMPNPSNSSSQDVKVKIEAAAVTNQSEWTSYEAICKRLRSSTKQNTLVKIEPQKLEHKNKNKKADHESVSGYDKVHRLRLRFTPKNSVVIDDEVVVSDRLLRKK